MKEAASPSVAEAATSTAFIREEDDGKSAREEGSAKGDNPPGVLSAAEGPGKNESGRVASDPPEKRKRRIGKRERARSLTKLAEKCGRGRAEKEGKIS